MPRIYMTVTVAMEDAIQRYAIDNGLSIGAAAAHLVAQGVETAYGEQVIPLLSHGGKRNGAGRKSVHPADKLTNCGRNDPAES